MRFVRFDLAIDFQLTASKWCHIFLILTIMHLLDRLHWRSRYECLLRFVSKQRKKRKNYPIVLFVYYMKEKEKKVGFTSFFPRYAGSGRRADSMYVYHYTLAFEPDFLLEQRNTLNSGCPS